MEVPINYLAVLVAAVINMVLGFAWYSPSLFGNVWMRLSGRTMADLEAGKKKMVPNMIIASVLAFVMAYVFAHVTVFAMDYTQTFGVVGGLVSGFWNWLGFILPVSAGAALWDGKSWKLVALTSGYYLVLLLINGVILATWR